MRYVVRVTLPILLAASVDIALYRVAPRERPQPLVGMCGFGCSEEAKREAQDERNALFRTGLVVSAAALALTRSTVVRFREKRFLDTNAAHRGAPFVPLLGTILGCVSLAAWLGLSYWMETASREIGIVTLQPVSPELPFVWIPALNASESAERDSLSAIAPAPPYPKVLVEDECFDLGAVPSDGTMCHHVCIKNVGDASLILSKPGWHRELKVGEALDYEMVFRVPEQAGFFAKVEVLLTNDPQRREIRMAVVGVSLRD